MTVNESYYEGINGNLLAMLAIDVRTDVEVGWAFR